MASEPGCWAADLSRLSPDLGLLRVTNLPQPGIGGPEAAARCVGHNARSVAPWVLRMFFAGCDKSHFRRGGPGTMLF